MSEWTKVTDLMTFEGQVYLTAHTDDIYPVPAFRIGSDWYRVTEGPEDIVKPEIGDLTRLLRPPTHVMGLPDMPRE